MIIPNIIIGQDRWGHNLLCGDVCKFKIKLQRPNQEERIEEMKGMIVYDADSYAYAFETLDNHAPFLCMYCAEENSIEKLFIANVDNFSSIPDGDKWRDIYNNNTRI